MRKLYFLPLLFLGCSHPAPKGDGPMTYRECLAKEERARESRFAAMPEGLKKLAGKHSVVKFFEQRPKNLSAIVDGLQKENATFNARKKREDENDTGLRLLDTSPGRNRVLVSFEKKSEFAFAKNEEDKIVLKLDYSKPVIGYFFPLTSLHEKNGVFQGQYKSSAKLNTPSSYTGDKTFKNLNITLYIKPVNKDYMYVEWVNYSYDRSEDPEWKNFIALLYTGDDDRFLDYEHPYFDPKGELNPEICTSLEGG